MGTDEKIRSRLMRTPAGVRTFRRLDHAPRLAEGRRLRWYVGAGTVTLLVLIGAGLPLAILLGLGDSTPHSVSSPAPLQAAPGASIAIPSGAVDVAVGEGAVWVSGFGRMTRLDPNTDHVAATVKTPGTEDYSQIAVGLGAVWVTADGGRLFRIDPNSDRVVATIRVGGAIQGVETGGGYVWVTRPTEGVGELIRVDPATNRLTGAPIEVGPGPLAALYAFGALWVTNTSPPSVVRVDPSTGTVSTMGFTGPSAAGFGSLWAAWDDSVVRTDPKTGKRTATIPVPRAQAVAVGQGRVWVLASPKSSSPTLFYPVKNTAALWEIDPMNNRIVGRPLRIDAQQPIALAVGGRAVWVADYNGGTVTRFDLVP